MDTKAWLKDGGIRSRKLWFSVFAIVMIFLGAFLAAKWPSFLPTFDTLAGSIVAISGLFLSGNIASRWVSSKNIKFKPTESTEDLPKGDKEDLSD